MNKKLLLIVTSVAILLLVLMTACSSQPPATTPDNTPVKTQEQTQVKNIAIATGPAGGSNYALGGGIMKIINSYLPGFSANAEATGGSNENLRLVSQGKVFMGFSGADFVYPAYHAQAPFTEALKINLAFGALPNFFYFVTLNPNIKSFQDLKGKRVAVGAPGSGMLTTSQLITKALGMTFDDFKPSQVGKTDAMENLKDGMVDAVLDMGALGQPDEVELFTTKKAYLVPLSESELSKIKSAIPYLVGGKIPKTSLPGLENDVPTIEAFMTVVVNPDADKDTVYKVVKVIFEHLDVLREAHSSGKAFSLETGAVDIGVPRHPGAEQYFKEAGALK